MYMYCVCMSWDVNFNVNDPVRRQLTSDNGSFQPKKRGVNLSIVRGVGND